MATEKVDAVVVGAGPGGYVAAIRLAQLGRKVILVDREKVGGVCLNYGCIPSKALIHAASLVDDARRAKEFGIDAVVSVDVTRLQAWKAGVVEKLVGGVKQLLKGNGVGFVEGAAKFVGPRTLEVTTREGGAREGVRRLEATTIIVATGARPFEVPSLPFDGVRVVGAREALAFDRVPARLLVVGGGVIGLELGTVYAKLGSKVTVVEMMDQLLPGVDPDAVRIVARGLKRWGVEVYVKSKAIGVSGGADARTSTRTSTGTTTTTGAGAGAGARGVIAVRVETPEKEIVVDADRVLVAVGMRPNTEGLGLDAAGIAVDAKGFVRVNARMETSVPGVFAIGDVSGPPLLAHKASKEGEIAAEASSGRGATNDVAAMPAAIFTDPEIATVGMSEADAKAKGIAVKVSKFPFGANGRALTTGAGEGFAKIVADEATKRVLGATIVGVEASNLVSEVALAIEMGAEAGDIGLTVHPHPTLSEALMESANAVLGEAIHALNR
ncbi:MAG: dihydrolipoyl dehydrogenase [Deltaproteobacteria bacterium]|nr:dihydrolipoyl dehydrogenase [Deltaproteobacteria bacterium]